MKQSRLISSTLLLTLFAFHLTTATAAAKEEWLRLKTSNFTVISNAGQKNAKRVAAQLEVFRSVLAQLLPRAKIASATPNTVFLFKDHYSFRPFKPKYKGDTRDNVAGYFLPGWDENQIALTGEVRGINPFEVIFHEYVHYVVNNSVGNTPIWLNEGLAEYYSTFTVLDDDAGRIRIGAPIARHIITLRNQVPLPLSKLLAVNRNSPEYNESAKAGVFYAQSWALVHYLLNGSEDGRRFPQLADFLKRLAAGTPRDEAFKQAFQADYQTIEKELRQYVSKFSFRVLEGNTTAAAGQDPKLLQAEPLSETESQVSLGNLQLRVGRADEAAERLDKAMRLDASYAPGLIAQATIKMQQDRLTEAESLLNDAVKSDAANYLGHFYHGALLGRQGKYQEAVEHYRKASSLKPESAWVMGELSLTYLKAGMEKESDETYLKALNLDPHNEAILHRRAFAGLELGHGARAAAAAVGYLNRQGWSEKHSIYVALVAYFGSRNAQRPEAAENILAEAAKRVDKSEWVFSVLQYLQRSITEAALLAQAGGDNDKLTEAHAYIGLDLALKGEREAALPHLSWVKDNGNKNFVEYPLATAELKRLESDK